MIFKGLQIFFCFTGYDLVGKGKPILIHALPFFVFGRTAKFIYGFDLDSIHGKHRNFVCQVPFNGFSFVRPKLFLKKYLIFISL